MQEIYSSSTRDLFLSLIENAGRLAKKNGRGVIAAIQQKINPVDFLAVFASAVDDAFYGEYPDRDHAFVAMGCAADLETANASRFADMKTAYETLFNDAQFHGFSESPEARPLMLGGFAFHHKKPDKNSPWAGFPVAKLILPEFLLSRYRDTNGEFVTSLSFFLQLTEKDQIEPLQVQLEQRITALSALLSGSSQESDRGAGKQCNPVILEEEGYKQRVEMALDEIDQGRLDKVVLARSCRVRCSHPFKPEEVLFNLRNNYPSCFIFAASLKGVAFLGATPERLLSLRGRQIQSGPIAGSAERGQSPEEDWQLEQRLFNSRKEQSEHAFVIEGIRTVLERFCVNLQHAREPCILKLPGIQHLYTEIAGLLDDDKDPSILDILEQLHPTSAVGGTPKEQALEWLANNEGLERGWYTGPVGWVNDRGEGDFAIALRATLLKGNEAMLYAGAGIVAGSLPDAELRETTVKMNAALYSMLDLEL
jgi:isochorismate synthase